MTLDKSPSRTTSWDVARLAGLSRSTVSQVLNGNDSRFPQDTRDRVAAAAAELNYRPSRAGRALVTGFSDVIVVLVPNTTFGRHLQDAVDELANATAARGMSVVVRYAGSNLEATMTAVIDLRPAAVVDLGVFDLAARRDARSAGIRFIPDESVFRPEFEDPNHYVGRLQAQHLMQTPGRQLVCALLSDSRQDPFGPVRMRGVEDEATLLGIPGPALLRVPLTREGATTALQSLVSQHPDTPLGICCYNDDVAIAVLAAARALGLTVPTEIAVIGVDHTEVGQLIEPPLTSVAVDLSAMIGTFLGDLEALLNPSDEPRRASPDIHEFVTVKRGETT